MKRSLAVQPVATRRTVAPDTHPTTGNSSATASDLPEPSSDPKPHEIESRYRLLTENLSDLVCEIDHHARFRYLSPNYRAVLGWDPTKMVGQDVLALAHPDDRAGAAEEIQKAFATGYGHREVRVQRADGQWRWFECIGRTYLNDAGEELVFLISRDVTERIEAAAMLAEANEQLRRELEERTRVERELRDSEERFRAIAETNPVPLLISRIDDGRILYANQRLAEIIGVPIGEILRRSTTEFYAALRDREQLMEAVARDGRVTDYELQVKRADGTPKWLWVSNQRISYQGQDAVLTGLLDITERRHNEERLRHDQKVLKQLLELQDRDRKLIAYEIHDGLVQDLTGALMFLESARQADREASQRTANIATSVELLRGAIHEARRLINGLRPPILDEAGVVPAIEHLTAELSSKAGLKISFTYDIQFDRLSPRLENTIYRIVQEALTNVHRHSQSPAAEVTLTQRNGQLHIMVRDRGIGFVLENVPPNRFGLTGLQERARLFGGQAKIDTHPGQGTTISVELPLADVLESGE